jgi:hypothetical protein
LLPSGKIYCSNSLADLGNRLSIYETKVASSRIDDHQVRGVHFFLGDPPLNPPTVRGSVLLRLNPQFLLDNAAHFLVGRPVDLDGVKFGHLPELPCDLSNEDLELDRMEFIDVCHRLATLEPTEWASFSSGRSSAPALDALKDILPISLIEYMRSTESFHARAFEYELSASYILRPQHVSSLHMPTTYTRTAAAKKLSARLGAKVIPYNPKYGIEEVRG